MIKTFIFIAVLLISSKYVFSQESESTNRQKSKTDTLKLKETDLFFFNDDETEAKFPGGISSWSKFLKNNLRKNIPIKNGAPNGTYKVIVSFFVSKTGKISNVKAETNFGHGMEKEVIRVIQKGPNWIPGTNNKKKINATRRQPVIFIVSLADNTNINDTDIENDALLT